MVSAGKIRYIFLCKGRVKKVKIIKKAYKFEFDPGSE